MSSAMNMPILLDPVYKEYVWGGTRFATDLRRRLLPGQYAESWEIADHPDGHTRMVNGPCAGRTLGEAIRECGEALLGRGRAAERFPLMVKLIDARETLSVQVHPDDRTAPLVGGEAKSEMWVVLRATPDAHIYSGFRPGVTPETFAKARADNTIPSLLQRFPARPGMVFHTPGGRVHAIGAGCLLLEVQQNANTTYRLYDWDRLDRDGRPRPLHLEKALRVIDWGLTGSPVASIQPETPVSAGRTLRGILATPHFLVDEWTLTGPDAVETEGDTFTVLFPTDGDLRIRAPRQPAMILRADATCLLPAAMTSFTLQPSEPGRTVRVLAIRLPPS